ncbi:hypothetical protein [[Limnothrix rosea] IAM M-220]|uniref:hypothetical protein n=1 Tax=[Limnothrix rosea] IAM M-220 TaxID=454133 RepID=UPI00095EFC54|nr:hypothetical protein [[Limnothrix rosea] IAM M-220]OKH17384.1 hypothetical protein NIES208_09725 [[Limnothrix rosea] IAM M-220]
MFKALFGSIALGLGAIATIPIATTAQTLAPDHLDLDSEIIETSPIIQEWTDEVPDVLAEIRHDPSFTTRWRVGFSSFPSTDKRSGWSIGVEDLFIKDAVPLTFSAGGHSTFDGDRHQFAARANYYLLPLGSRINIAPTLGYHTFSGEDYDRDGLEVGGKIQLNLSRSGASTLSLSQQFVNLSGDQEMGITTLGAGYAFAEHLRLATEIQKHNSTAAKESRVGIFLEFLP